MVTEEINITLADELARRSLSRREIDKLVADVLKGLSALHRSGLVYMNLSPESISASDSGWILNRQKAAHKAGKMDVAETRPMLGRSGYVPPEAYGGDVSPKWDIWSLGVLIRRVFQGNAPRPSGAGRAARPQPLPPPFEDVVRECMWPSPVERASLKEIAAVLNINLDEAPREPDAAASEQPDATVAPPLEVRREKEAPVDLDEGTRARAHEVVSRRREAALRAVQEEGEKESTGNAPRPNRTKWIAASLSLLLAVGILAYLESTKKTDGDREPRPEPKSAAVSPDVPAQQSTPAPEPVRTEEPPPAPNPVAAEQKPVGDSPGTKGTPVDQAARKAAIDRLVEEWVEAVRSRSTRGLAETYAPQVTRYLGSPNLTRKQVLQKRDALLRQIKTTRQFRAGGVEIESMADDHAIVSFRKEWGFNGRFLGSERQRLGLAWNGERWQIEREEVVPASSATARK